MADQCPYLKASLNSEKRHGNGANKTVAEGRLVQLLEGIKHKCLKFSREPYDSVKTKT